LLKDRNLVNHLKIVVLIDEGLLPVVAAASLKDLGKHFPVKESRDTFTRKHYGKW
jgi:hypothetical protein